MNSMLWLRSLQEVFAPFRIFCVKDSQFMRSRGTNASSHGPAARQGSGFRGESSEPCYPTTPRVVSALAAWPIKKQHADTQDLRIGVVIPEGGRGLPEATFCMGHGPLPGVASAFVLRQPG